MRLKTRGHTVIEMLVALGIGAIVIALGATIGFRHQRFHRDIVLTVERTERLDQISALLPITLRAIAPAEGDIAPGAARDTSLEFRATIVSAVLCDSSSLTILLAPAGVSPRLTSVLTRPEVGDTVWALETLATTERWVPRQIIGVADSTALCRLGASLPYGVSPRASIALRLAAAVPPGTTIVRITRPWRFSLYRASDGSWYLGAKDWNPALSRFNTIQPVAGPLLSAAASGLRFRYLDSLGAALPSATIETRRIAAIEVAVRVDSRDLSGRGTSVIALRNRAR